MSLSTWRDTVVNVLDTPRARLITRVILVVAGVIFPGVSQGLGGGLDAVGFGMHPQRLAAPGPRRQPSGRRQPLGWRQLR